MYLFYFFISITIFLISIFLFFFIQKPISNKKIKWAENLNEIYYTYSKEDYDRKYLKQYSFFNFSN